MRETVSTALSPDRLVGLTLSSNTLQALLDNDKRPHALKEVNAILNGYSDKQILALTEILIRGIGSDDEAIWNVDRRDGALVLLEAIPFENKRINPQDLSKIYLEQLRTQRGQLDPLGRASTLVEAGKILYPYLPSGKKFIDRASNALDMIEGSLENTDGTEELKVKMQELKDKINDKTNRKKGGPIQETKDVVGRTLSEIQDITTRKDKDDSGIKPDRKKRAASSLKPQRKTNESPPEKIWPPNTEESVLVKAAKKGERGAFKVLVERTYPDLLALAQGLMGNPEDAIDVVQDAFTKAFRHIKRFRGDAQFSTWMYRITTNTAIDHLEKRGKHQHEELDETHPDSTSQTNPEAMSEAELLRARTTDALAKLPERLRAVVVLRDVYDLTHEAIAKELGITEAAAKVRLHRARRKLREELFPKPGEEKARAVD